MGYFRLLFTVARYSSLLSVVLEMPFSEVQCCSFVEYFFNGVGKRCVWVVLLEVCFVSYSRECVYKVARC